MRFEAAIDLLGGLLNAHVRRRSFSSFSTPQRCMPHSGNCSWMEVGAGQSGGQKAGCEFQRYRSISNVDAGCRSQFLYLSVAQEIDAILRMRR